jgi:transcriptional regulator with XRE-family HTH domain
LSVIGRIVKILESKNIEQKELCLKTGIGQSTFSSWKKNYRNVPTDKLLLIADFLEVPIRYLMTGEGEEAVINQISQGVRELTEQEEELLRIFNSLNMKDKTSLLSHAYELEEQNK